LASFSIDKVQNKDGEYAVIIDRISQDVPFYRAYLKNAALTGTNVTTLSGGVQMINFLIIISRYLGVPLPNTVFYLPQNIQQIQESHSET
jgi:hypothetical protein